MEAVGELLTVITIAAGTLCTLLAGSMVQHNRKENRKKKGKR